MQFKVPQFIEVESKIIGPLTFKQAIYVGGSLGFSYVLLKVLPTFLSVPSIILVLLFGWALAFLPRRKYGKTFIEIVEAAFKYIVGARLYTWKRGVLEPKKEGVSDDNEPLLFVPKISSGKLDKVSKDLELAGMQNKK